MLRNAGCRRRRLAVLALATSWLAACETGGSERPVAVCQPVPEYSPESQARAADELIVLPEHRARWLCPAAAAEARRFTKSSAALLPASGLIASAPGKSLEAMRGAA